MRASIVIALAVLMPLISNGQIKVSDNHRYLADINGNPFFWQGDTCWELFHRMTREEAAEFFDIRKRQGFNVIQAVALAEFNGIREPNRYGDWPLNNEDPLQLLTTPGSNPANAYEYDYWDHVDYLIDLAATKGIIIGLLPTWGDKVTVMWGDGPQLFNEANALGYARIIASRYKDRKNIVWILGGDRPAVYKSKRTGTEKDYDDRPIWNAMAKGIEEVLGPDAFISYHPSGGQTSSTDLHTASWLDMNAQQSGHGSREAKVWETIAADWALQPAKPVLDMEPCYEDHPVNPWDGKWTKAGRGYFSAYDVRARIYRGVFAGGCGVTYGHHHIWQFMNPALYKPINTGDTIIAWQQAALAEAAGDLQYLRNLMLSRPYFKRVPVQDMVSAQVSTFVDKVVATRDGDGSYAFVYLPQGKTVYVSVASITGSTKNIWWYNPRNGKASKGEPLKRKGDAFTPPGPGDWVLVIDDASRNYPEPGAR